MNTRNKSILIFVAGIITGFILTILLALILQPRNTDENLQLFEKPAQEIKANSFRVMQVLPDGSALAMVNDISSMLNNSLSSTADNSVEIGTIVLFLNNNNSNTNYYDKQIITRPSGKHFRQIGIYRYITKQEMMKTVPVIALFDK
ncbi:hypothetical protein HMPREF9332_01009 [Alloprevotella rava F0323]|uniref:Uncharacterized protein n=1 Tax=Alloprevotella rava F0323 TaxID=679199 RepID=G5GBQ8_9BACT|nr:hypothetical protein [Alloprevotella rava]EHG22962.1 hypothetical protein HMPREF9332_01009 [Alloprevotella rava F0323]